MGLKGPKRFWNVARLRQTHKNTEFTHSVFYAIRGIYFALEDERNFRFQTLVTVLVIIAGFLLKITLLEWLILILTVGFVLVSELINTAIENTVDLACGKTYHDLAMKAKDVAAGAVFLASTVAFIIGLIIFGPKLWELLI